MGTFKVSGLNHWGGFGEKEQSSVNKLPFIPKRKLKKKEGVHSPEYLEVSQWKDMENRDYPKRKVLVSNLLHDREAVMLYSPTGVGKTWLSLSIALIAAGKGRLEILDWANDDPQPVCYVDGEMLEEDIQERIKLLIPITHCSPVRCESFDISDICFRMKQTLRPRWHSMKHWLNLPGCRNW